MFQSQQFVFKFERKRCIFFKINVFTIKAVSARKISNFFFCFDMDNVLSFAVVKNLRKFGGCLLDNNTFFF